jgi:hypothetical protein
LAQAAQDIPSTGNRIELSSLDNENASCCDAIYERTSYP